MCNAHWDNFKYPPTRKVRGQNRMVLSLLYAQGKGNCLPCTYNGDGIRCQQPRSNCMSTVQL